MLKAGDILYIPQHWWHHVRSFDCPNIAISLWFHPFAMQEDSEELLPEEEAEEVRVTILLSRLQITACQCPVNLTF